MRAFLRRWRRYRIPCLSLTVASLSPGCVAFARLQKQTPSFRPLIAAPSQGFGLRPWRPQDIRCWFQAPESIWLPQPPLPRQYEIRARESHRVRELQLSATELVELVVSAPAMRSSVATP